MGVGPVLASLYHQLLLFFQGKSLVEKCVTDLLQCQLGAVQRVVD